MSSRPSPLTNRVTPDGQIVANPARGLMMGNRGGRIHEGWQLRRRQASRRWISCVTEFRERHRAVWQTGYTELFFLDEATALAAGHRPCFECRRTDARAFAAAWAEGHGLKEPPRADEMDRVLAIERGKPQQMCRAGDLPEGAMFKANGIWLVVDGGARCWSHDGYSAASALPKTPVVPITPPAICRALAAGYRPRRHPSAAREGPSAKDA